MVYRFASLGCLFLGEALCIWAEMVMAFNGGVSLAPLVTLLFGAVMLSVGYVYGTKFWGDIWIVTLVSTGAIVLVEPLLAWSYFGTLPQGRTLWGLALVVAGFIVTGW